MNDLSFLARSRRLAAALALPLGFVLLAGCAQTPPAPPPAPERLLHDAWFAVTPLAVDAQGLFELSDEMRRYVLAELAPGATKRDPRRALLDALYTHGKLKLSYDASRTRTAAQVFESRSANCLSLVIMTAAFAKHLGLPVTFQTVATDPMYSRTGGLIISNMHVNLVLGTVGSQHHRGDFFSWEQSLVVDFLPPEEVRGLSTLWAKPISEQRVVAMYFSNRAAEALAEDRIDEAYAWARRAWLHDPQFTPAANTLAVIYMRRGELAAAETALQLALAQEPSSTDALSNLQIALQGLGRSDEAAAVGRRLLALQPVAPFHDYDLGRRAMAEGDFKRAQTLFQQELRRQPFQAEVHFWAARASWELGNTRDASEHLRRAVETSPTTESRQLYGAKLEVLKALRVQ